MVDKNRWTTRIISICRFLNNDFSIEGKYFKSFREQRDEIRLFTYCILCSEQRRKIRMV